LRRKWAELNQGPGAGFDLLRCVALHNL